MADDTELDTEWTDEITCPHCGYEYTDSYESGTNGEGDWNEECHSCSKAFRCSRNVSVTYTSSKHEVRSGR